MGEYIMGSMISNVVEDGKLEEFLDTFYGEEYSKGVQSEENEVEGESQDV